MKEFCVMKLKRLTSGGMIAALYAVLTVALEPISYGAVQFRVAEALTLLPFYLPEAIPGLFAGCLMANLYGGNGPLDVLLGSAATLAAAFLSRRAPRLWLATLPPILINMAVIGTLLSWLYSLPLWLTIFQVGAGQTGVCFFVGIPLMKTLEKHGVLKECVVSGASMPPPN
jgi:uncharacterized membrane protein